MKKNRKGFTLIELLAVIVILAIIALIASPIILNVIEESRNKANINSTYGLVDSARLYYAQSQYGGPIVYDLTGQKQILDVIEYSGTKPSTGFVTITDKGDVFVAAYYDDKCYVKDFDSATVEVSEEISLCGVSK